MDTYINRETTELVEAQVDDESVDIFEALDHSPVHLGMPVEDFHLQYTLYRIDGKVPNRLLVSKQAAALVWSKSFQAAWQPMVESANVLTLKMIGIPLPSFRDEIMMGMALSYGRGLIDGAVAQAEGAPLDFLRWVEKACPEPGDEV